jgi:hypothetical protein
MLTINQWHVINIPNQMGVPIGPAHSIAFTRNSYNLRYQPGSFSLEVNGYFRDHDAPSDILWLGEDLAFSAQKRCQCKLKGQTWSDALVKMGMARSLCRGITLNIDVNSKDSNDRTLLSFAKKMEMTQ